MNNKKLDPMILIVPLIIILALCAAFVIVPDASAECLEKIRFFLGDTIGVWYLVVGLGFFLVSVYLAFSAYGDVKLGREDEKPQYSFFAWGAMMFTSGLAADILFYSLCEWILYAEDPHIAEMGTILEWSGTYPLFHWGPIPWSFYLVLACAFGFMLHVRGVKKQKFSESCRPILGDKTDGFAGRFIDLFAVVALLAGTATTFSLATPLLSILITDLLGIPQSTGMTILILAIICAVYTFSVVKGMKGILDLASSCVYLFIALLLYILVFGGQTRFILEEGIASLGNLVEHFFTLSTYTDPERTTNFPQNWTIFYWAYWMVWCVASPFFIGSISRGRTVRQTILGGYVFGLGGTFTSFIILGNYSLGLFTAGKLDVIGLYRESEDLYSTIIGIIHTLPLAPVVMILLVVAMVAFYATSFDAIAVVAASYSYRELENEEETSKGLRVFWSILLILLPMALVFSENSMNNLQTVSIIAAFPLSFILIMIVGSFLKDAKKA